MKNLLTLILLLTAATGWSQDSLKNASLIGQSTRNQKVGQGFQVGFVGSSDDTLQVHTKFQLVSGSPAAGRVLTSSATGIATWQTPSANLKRGNGVYISNDSIGVGRVAFIENLVWQYADKFFAISDSADINVATNFFTVGDVGAGNSRLLVQLHRLQFTGTNRITLTSGDDLTASVADDMTITVGGDITERAYITIGSAVLDTINGLINGDYYEKHRANLFTQRIYKTGVSTFAIGPDLARFDADSSRKLHAVSFGGNGDTVGTKIAGVASDAHIYQSTVLFSNKHNVLADYYTPTSGQMLISDSTGWGFWATQTMKASIDTSGIGTFTGLNFSNKGINTTSGDGAIINGSSGRFRKDATGTTFTLTNSFITANSIIICTQANAAPDATAVSWSVLAGSGSATIEFIAAPSGDFDMNFVVFN